MDKCDCCGFSTSRHLIHTKEGTCYCLSHYLTHILHDDIEGEIKKLSKFRSN